MVEKSLLAADGAVLLQTGHSAHADNELMSIRT